MSEPKVIWEKLIGVRIVESRGEFILQFSHADDGWVTYGGLNDAEAELLNDLIAARKLNARLREALISAADALERSGARAENADEFIHGKAGGPTDCGCHSEFRAIIRIAGGMGLVHARAALADAPANDESEGQAQ